MHRRAAVSDAQGINRCAVPVAHLALDDDHDDLHDKDDHDEEDAEMLCVHPNQESEIACTFCGIGAARRTLRVRERASGQASAHQRLQHVFDCLIAVEQRD